MRIAVFGLGYVGSVASVCMALMKAFCEDTKLNFTSKYLQPEMAFGGSCPPNSVRRILYVAREHGVRLPLIGSILPSNEIHLDQAVNILVSSNCHIIGLAGIIFKADTDDVKKSPAAVIACRLTDTGKEALIFEPELILDWLVGIHLAYLDVYLQVFRSWLVDQPTIGKWALLIALMRNGEFLRMYSRLSASDH